MRIHLLRERQAGLVCSFVCALFVLASASTAQAGFSSGFTGHTVFGVPDPGADGVVSFSVYTPEDADWTDDFGAGFDGGVTAVGNPVDADAGLVFFYEVVNTNPAGNPNDALERFTAATGFTHVSSFGYVSGHVFNEPGDVANPVGPAGNRELGTATASTGDTSGDATPTESGASLGSPAFVANGSAIAPITAALVPSGVRWRWVNPSTLEPNLVANGFSTILFITIATGAAVYDVARLEDTGDTFGDVPSPTPVPGGIALLLSGCPALMGLWMASRRRRASSEVQTA